MRAVRFAAYGGPEVLELVDAPEPHPGPGQIRVTVRAAGVNGIDWKVRSGAMRDAIPLTLPAGTGRDAAGIVDELGPDVRSVALRDTVFGTGRETLAEHAVLTAWTGKPESLGFAEAAGYPIPVETARRVLDELGVQAGQTLVVSGASGGVGSAVVQFACARGVIVIGTASEDNQEYLRSLGAQATTYGEGFAERVRALAPRGVDAALDVAGAGVIPELIALTGDPGRVVSIADFSASRFGARTSSRPVDPVDAYREAVELFRAGRFRLPVARTFSLAEAADAHRRAAAGHAAGRLVITLD